MSSDPDFIARLGHVLNKIQLDAIVVGNAGGILHGAPLLTEDVDLFLRDTPQNRKKVHELAKRIGGSSPKPIDDTYRTLRIRAAAQIDVLFWIGDELPFGTVRARSRRIKIGRREAITVASLRDIIRSKEIANRPKDVAALPILRDTLRVEEAAQNSHGRFQDEADEDEDDG